MLFKNGVRTLNFFVPFSFGSHPLQAYLIFEVECFALFCDYSGCLEVVLLLGVPKQLFQGMLVGHRLFSCSVASRARLWLIFGSESRVRRPRRAGPGCKGAI